jgi:hypothetical protein
MQVIPSEQDWQLGIQYAQVSDPVGKYWLGWVLASEHWVKHVVPYFYSNFPCKHYKHIFSVIHLLQSDIHIKQLLITFTNCIYSACYPILVIPSPSLHL